ncbi:MFS transporter [Neobacillus sp. OS1-32]|uniref:MFS transporter n=1 Tax=Neobacillus sp. OS1-32 TaxID=3070682 RepID=UPI0027E1378F|nr:MFS transporter [Neobacillus sp. OS1-32]WML32407.1 MFS transporter [Neobacillus sp. OS1-32]
MDGLGKESGLGTKISLFFLVFMVMMIIIRPISGIVFDRLGHKILVFPACLFGIAALLLLGITNNVTILLLSAFFYGLSYGVLQPTLQSWAVSQAGPNNKGTANAMILTGMDLGMALGSPLLGWIAGKAGYSAMFGYSSLFLLLLLLVYIFHSFQSKNMISIEKQKKYL